MIPDLPRYTWDQAEVLGMFPAASYALWKVPAGTVRRWASEGLIQARGIGPNNTKLYLSPEVSRCADRDRETPGRKPKSQP